MAKFDRANAIGTIDTRKKLNLPNNIREAFGGAFAAADLLDFSGKNVKDLIESARNEPDAKTLFQLAILAEDAVLKNDKATCHRLLDALNREKSIEAVKNSSDGQMVVKAINWIYYSEKTDESARQKAHEFLAQFGGFSGA